VITKGSRPAGRGSRMKRTAVAEAAESRGLPLAEIDRISSDPDLVRAAAPDVLAVVAYGEILSREILDIAPLGAVNLHFSLLPRWRGASPVRRVLLEGDETTGVTTMLIDEGLDTGPILRQVEEPVRSDDDAGSLGARLAAIGAPLLVETIRSLDRGEIEPRAQDEELATSTGKFGPSDFRIDWALGADAVVRFVRASSPDPGASTTFRGEVLKLFRAEVIEGGGEPGSITGSAHGPVVAAGSDAVLLREVAVAGRKRMTGTEFARGARIVAGERLS
jgi:methionyl-tRNA formyltransferase